MKKNKSIFLGIMGSLILAAAFVAAPVAQAVTYTPISGGTLRSGVSSGDNVMYLQQFLASDLDVFSGTADGKFGPITRKGVIQFQLAYGLNTDGVVGPITRAKINSLISAGFGIDRSAPMISNVSLSASGRNENVAFTTNEPVKTAVFYDVSPINWNSWDDSVMSLATPNISGLSSVDGAFSQSKQLTLSNLNASANYHYVITATDQSGNTAVVWPSTFVSGQ